jgi:hypothetical protein
MLWIKRNLFLAVGGLIAILLLAGGVYYFISAQQRNRSIEEELEANKSDLNRLQGQNPYPSAQNIEIAKKEAEKLRAAVGQLHRYFSPVPSEKVSGIEFRRYLDRTLAELQASARSAKTVLPSPGYAFSFETQKPKTSFGDGTFPAVPEQIAEVRALMQVMFDAHVTPLINVRRARVSKDDEISTAASDYLSLKVQTNSTTGTVNSPYEVTFGCLSSELAAVLEGLASSKHGFVVKAINVEPAAEMPTNAPAGFIGTPGNPPGRGAPPRQAPGGRPQPAVGTPSAASRSGTDRPVILLNERRLKVTLLIYVIKAVK